MIPTPSEAEPLTERELAALPVFPLPNVVMLPGSVLPLHLFEPRYRAMARDCIESGPRALALALLRPGWQSDYHGRPRIHDIAGAGRIVAHRANGDGTYDILLSALSRVRLSELVDEQRPYRVARAEMLVDLHDDESVRPTLTSVLGAAAQLAATRRTGSMPPPIDLSGSPGRIADRIADRWLEHDPAARQAILEALDVNARLALLGDALAGLLAARLATQRGDRGTAN